MNIQREEKLLHVIAPHFCAGALWRHNGVEFVCTAEVAPILYWMRTKTAQEASDYLRSKGWHYYWSDPLPDQ